MAEWLSAYSTEVAALVWTARRGRYRVPSVAVRYSVPRVTCVSVNPRRCGGAKRMLLSSIFGSSPPTVAG